ncbi:FixH family protein [Marinomonas ostreistagni]|uniref:FixH family protein n=1 Tax=Marinomonas ostreistagni TaxID=359209 RepID=A0ABS0Z924_9GAMM|nr:FixH family protein [Marinomonas ostreistagni]MBJ7549501.1 FixH family protein [Marinomonas ostreistagni]
MSSTAAPVWYKQFWPWFIISIPLSSVLVAVVQIYAALHSSSDLVKDDYYKEGLAINQVITKRETAKSLAIKAHLRMDNVTGELLLNTEHATAPQLTALFAHAALSSKDFSIILKKVSPNEYRAQLEKPLSGIWNVYLESPNGWQLNGRVNSDIHDHLNFNL